MSKPLSYRPQAGQFYAIYPTTRRGRRLARIDWRATKRFLRRLTKHAPQFIVTSLGIWAARFVPVARTNYSHIAFIYYVRVDGHVLIAEQCKHGIRLRWLQPGEWTGDLYDWVEPLTPQELDAMRSWWDNNIGQPYSWFHLARLLWWSLLGSVLPINYEKVKLSGSGTVCVTACDRAAFAGGRDAWPQLSQNMMAICLFVRSPQLRRVATGWSVKECDT